VPAQFRAPPEEELTELARKWVAVERLVTEEYGTSITTDVGTLALLQRVVDDDLVDDRYGAQCLGADTSLCIFPVTMISKRVERGEAVDVAKLYDETNTRIAALANDVD
jgi:hypothetical protein